MRLFGSERISHIMDRMGLKEGEVIEAGMMNRAIHFKAPSDEAFRYGRCIREPTQGS